MQGDYAKRLIALQREIEALKAAKVKSARKLVVATKTASISLTVTLIDGFYYSNAAQFTVKPLHSTNFLCECTLNTSTVGQSRDYVDWVQPNVVKLSADGNGIVFQIQATYLNRQNPPNPWRINWGLTFTATDDFTLSGPTYVNIR